MHAPPQNSQFFQELALGRRFSVTFWPQKGLIWRGSPQSTSSRPFYAPASIAGELSTRSMGVAVTDGYSRKGRFLKHPKNLSPLTSW